jgi:hypothetical protein
MTTKILYQGPPDDTDEWCDHDSLDDKECDDNKLWVIVEDGSLVGFVCANHKDAYEKAEGLA